VAALLCGQVAAVPKRNPSSIGVGARTTKTRSAVADPFASRQRDVLLAVAGDSNELPRNRPHQNTPRSLVHQKQPPLESSRQVDPGLLASLKSELALWRAFLGDEIDAILRDKD
jgi:hypothetical protein